MSDILEIQSHCSEVDDHESMPVTFSQKGSPKTALIPGPSEKLVFSAKRRKGRGFDGHCDSELDNIKHFDSLVYDPIKKEDHPQKCKNSTFCVVNPNFFQFQPLKDGYCS